MPVLIYGHLNKHDFSLQDGCVLTIGVFDGIHQGHRKLIKRIVQISNYYRINSVLLTFDTHPLNVIHKPDTVKLLNTIEEKAMLLENTGLDYILVVKFTHEFASIDAHSFITDILIGRLWVKHIVVGSDFRFGKNREGTIKILKEYGNKYGFFVEEFPLITKNEVKIGSSHIRTLISEGKIQEANELLGYPYFICGTVQQGRGLSSQLGFPSVNIPLPPNKVLPPPGVFSSFTLVDGEILNSTTYLGYSPTLLKRQQIISETHIHNFNRNIIGKKIMVFLIEKIREEIKFKDVDELKRQVQQDISQSEQSQQRAHSLEQIYRTFGIMHKEKSR